MKTVKTMWLAMVAVLIFGTACQAVTYVLFSNLPENNNYLTSGYSTIVSGSSGGHYYRSYMAMAFTPDKSVNFERLELPLEAQDAQSAVVYLMSDNGGKPGAFLDTITLTNVVPSVKNYVHALLIATSVSKPAMTAGTQYWAVVATANDTSMHTLRWYNNSQGYSGLGAKVTTVDGDMTTWVTGTYSVAFRVVGASSACARPLGDLNNDCKVDFRDYAILLNSWLFCGYANPNDC